MLNKDNIRELAYVVRIDNISGMDADRLECAHVKGWNIVVGKSDFDVGDLAIYFEIDSKLPEVEPFCNLEFLKSKHYKIKSQKIRGVVSQGLLMPATAFGWFYDKNEDCIVVDANPPKDKSRTSSYELAYYEGDFLTEKLGVTYSVVEDNQRKSNPGDKYKKMAQRHPDLAKKNWWKWLYKKNWGKKLLFIFFGKKKDIKREWPYWLAKTDEERCQNLNWSNYAKTGPWIITEKIDGTSTSFTMKRGKKILFWNLPNQFYICSRNVVFNKPDKKCFYDTNYYVLMAEKYNIEKALNEHLSTHPDIDWVTIQGETYGSGVQKRDYSLNNEQKFMAFNFVDSKNSRWNSNDACNYLRTTFNIPWVPILGETILPETVDEMLTMADGISCIDGKMREGLVLRTLDGKGSFKAVSNDYLLKYHN